MLKPLLTLFMFLTIVSSEMVVNIMSYHGDDIELIDHPMDGESESENKENSKEEFKIETSEVVLPFYSDELMIRGAWVLEHFTDSHSLEFPTPPPEV